MGNRIFGCDDCLAVCPWNKFARATKDAKLKARQDLISPDLSVLAKLDDHAFRSLFAGSPVKRVGRDRFVRNVLIAIGNSGNRNLAAVAYSLLGDPSPLVRAMAVWAWRTTPQPSLGRSSPYRILLGLQPRTPFAFSENAKTGKSIWSRKSPKIGLQ